MPADLNNYAHSMSINQNDGKVMPNVAAQLTGSNVQDAQAIPTKLQAKVITLANAVAVTDTNLRIYDLITNGGLTEDEIRRYRKIKVSLVNTHNQAANIKLATAVSSLGVTVYSSSGEIYVETGSLPASPGRLTLQSKAGGTGASPQVKAVPALEDIHSNLFVTISFGTAPTSGSFTIKVELGG